MIYLILTSFLLFLSNWSLQQLPDGEDSLPTLREQFINLQPSPPPQSTDEEQSNDKGSPLKCENGVEIVERIHEITEIVEKNVTHEHCSLVQQNICKEVEEDVCVPVQKPIEHPVIHPVCHTEMVEKNCKPATNLIAVCSPDEEEFCYRQPEFNCKEEPRTIQDAVLDKVCNLEYVEECSTRFDNQCAYVTETKCVTNTMAKCRVTFERKCKHGLKQVCKNVRKKLCHISTEKSCKKVPKRECKVRLLISLNEYYFYG